MCVCVLVSPQRQWDNDWIGDGCVARLSGAQCWSYHQRTNCPVGWLVACLLAWLAARLFGSLLAVAFWRFCCFALFVLCSCIHISMDVCVCVCLRRCLFAQHTNAELNALLCALNKRCDLWRGFERIPISVFAELRFAPVRQLA